MVDTREAQEAIDQLFELMDIARVVCIDDQYTETDQVEEVIGLCADLGPEPARCISGLEAIPFGADREIWQQALRTLWDRLGDKERSAIGKQLRGQSKAAAEDPRNVGLLAELLAGHDFRQIPPGVWQSTKAKLLEEAGAHKTLFLFDQVLSPGGGVTEDGIALIREALGSEHGNTVMCGLLSRTFSPGQEYEEWQRLAKAYDIDQDRFVLISKQHLVEDPLGLARMLKLAILTTQCSDLKKRVSSIIVDAHEEARQRVDEINVYDFEHIVFRSSYQEGVWEPDTLFRVFGVFHRASVLRRARAQEALRKLASGIRKASSVRTDSFGPPKPKPTSWRIQRLELYDGAEDVNAHHLPIDLGDIFERTTGGGKRYILLAQPCDLMVRSSDGKRRPSATEAMLAEIVQARPSGEAHEVASYEACFELPYFASDDGESWFVDFRRAFAVRLCILDLCVYQDDGSAVLNADHDCDDEVIPAWQLHYSELRKLLSKAIRRYHEFCRNQATRNTLRLLIPCSSNENVFNGTISPTDNEIRYDLRRVGRLRQPRAGALLVRFSNYMARAAFEHDFGRLYDSNGPGDRV